MTAKSFFFFVEFNPLNAELNPICHLLALLGGATIVVVSRLRVNIKRLDCTLSEYFYFDYNWRMINEIL